MTQLTREAFEAEVLAMQDTLYRVSYSLLPNPYDQDDAVQECVRIALQKRESLRQPQFVRTWLVRILINECYSVLRKKKHEMPTDAIEIIPPPDGDSAVIDALMQLEEKQRLPLVLHYMEGYSIREIARMLRAPESTVKTRMSRGRSLLRGLLDDTREGGVLL